MKYFAAIILVLSLTACDPVGIKAHNEQVAQNFYPKCLQAYSEEYCRREATKLMITREDVRPLMNSSRTINCTTTYGKAPFSGRPTSSTTCY